jgi:hypothetical protein
MKDDDDDRSIPVAPVLVVVVMMAGLVFVDSVRVIRNGSKSTTRRQTFHIVIRFALEYVPARFIGC